MTPSKYLGASLLILSLVLMSVLEPRATGAEVISKDFSQLIPSLPGQVVAPLPDQLVKSLPGQLVKPLPGQLVRALPGQVVRLKPSDFARSLPGQIVSRYPRWTPAGTKFGIGSGESAGVRLR